MPIDVLETSPHRARPLKVGYWLPETEHRRGSEIARWTELKALAQCAEAVGFDSVWAADRLLFQSERYPTHGGWECWSLMAALAATTKRVELCQYVTNSLFRNPALMAKIATTVDEISDGRVILCLGAGDRGGDAEKFGYSEDNLVSRFEEAIQIISSLLRTGHADFDGRFYQVRDCELRPRGPRPSGLPILIATRYKPRMLRLAAQYADLWNTFYPIPAEDVHTTLEPLYAACAKVGRESDSLIRTLTVPVDLPGLAEHAPTTAYGIDRAGVATRNGVRLTGEPEAIAEGLRAYARVGIGHVIVWLHPDTIEGIQAFAPVLELLDRG